MTRNEQERIDALDRQWDAYQDGQSVEGGDHESIAELYARDGVPAPSADFRRRLEASLREAYPVDKAGTYTDISRASSEPKSNAQRAERVRPFTRPSTLRQWGELAAIVAILSLAIVGAARYGDDAYDFAQNQLASGDEALNVSEQRDILAAEGEIDGLTFEEAQALTPFEMVKATSLPDDASIEQHEVTKSEIVERGRRYFTMWRGTTEIMLRNDDAEPVLLRQQPAMQHLPIPMPLIEGDEPSGRLQVVEIAGTGAVRVLEHADGGEIITHYAWRQGDVDLWLAIPFDASDSSNPIEGLDKMMASIAEQGPLDDGGDEIPHRAMSLAELREAMPTVPVADPTPEHLELTRVDNSIYGPHFTYDHPSSEDTGAIWLRAIGSTAGMHLHNRVEDAGSETIHVGDVAVSRHILSDRYTPETAEFIETVRLRADLLLTWISSDSDTALAIYMWDVAGQSYLMGVEIPHDAIDTESHEDPLIATDRPEADWLQVISAQEAFVAEHLELDEVFPVFARDAKEEDQVPGQEDADSRRIGATSNSLYYVAYDDERSMIMLHQFVEVEGEDAPRSSGGGSPLWHAAEYGVFQQMGGGGGFHVAWLLPRGYDEVVDEDGNVIGAVEDQLFVMSFGGGDPQPSTLIARGPVGELHLDSRSSAPQ